MKKQIYIYQVVAFIVICIVIAFFTKEFHLSKETSNILNTTAYAEAATTPTTTLSKDTNETSSVSSNFSIKLSFVGDCLCATDENTYYENCFNDVANAKSPEYFFKKVSPYFLNDDFTVADCENVFSDSKNLAVRDKGQYANPSIEAYWFKSAAKNAKILSAGGIDCVSISNNHINDYNEQGRQDTKNALDAANVQWGEEGKIIYYEKNGYKLSVICVSMYNSYAVDNIKKYIKKASKKSAYQIIYFHGGEEAIHEPEDWKIQACHDLIDSGADLIMGDHPHVLQPLEKYKDKTIIYSLGNFIFGGNRHPENRTIIYQHELVISNGSLTTEKGSIIPCYVYTGDTNNWQPDIIEDIKEKNKVINFMNGKRNLPY